METFIASKKMNLRQRCHTKELLDSDHIPFDDIKKEYAGAHFINTWLGGHRISIGGLKTARLTNAHFDL